VSEQQPRGSGRDPSVRVDAPGDPAAAEDPLAADRRTMVIGGAAMVALILVGVVSAQLFARGGCVSIVEPGPVTDVDTEVAPADLLRDELGVDGAAIVAALESVAGVPVTTAAAVGDAHRVLPLDEGLVTAGRTVTSFDGSLTAVSTFDTDAAVVGSGPTVYEATIANEATGQTDALVPLTGSDLDVGTCVDTAVVGSPFAFHLTADDGQLLLLRADEDGDRPELQLRDDESGAIWDTRIVLPAGPPGTLAERSSAGLGPDAVVTARRTSPQEEEPVPAVFVHEREDGEERHALDGSELATATGLDPDAPVRWEVASVGTTTALLHGRPDPADAPEDAPVATDGALVLIDLLAGDVISTVTDVGPVLDGVRDPLLDRDRYLVATATAGGGDPELRLVAGDGDAVSVDDAPDGSAHLAWLGDGAIAGGDGEVLRVGPAGATVAEPVEGVRVADVTVTTDGRVAVLLVAADDASVDQDGDGGEDTHGGAVLVVTTRTVDVVSTTSTDG
jgi:hypothetical protein